jgi:hypothetical protein
MRRMKNPPTKFVLFADVLGFKRLVLDNRVPFPQSLDFRDRGWGVAAPPRRNPMARGFTGFHGAIEMVTERTAWQEAELMVFSDSLFLATADARECMEFASDLMRRAIAVDVALRMGIGYGTFVSYGFSFQHPRARVGFDVKCARSRHEIAKGGEPGGSDRGSVSDRMLRGYGLPAFTNKSVMLTSSARASRKRCSVEQLRTPRSIPLI